MDIVDLTIEYPNIVKEGRIIFVKKNQMETYIRIPKPPITGEYVLKSVDGVVSWELN